MPCWVQGYNTARHALPQTAVTRQLNYRAHPGLKQKTVWIPICSLIGSVQSVRQGQTHTEFVNTHHQSRTQEWHQKWHRVTTACIDALLITDTV